MTDATQWAAQHSCNLQATIDRHAGIRLFRGFPLRNGTHPTQMIPLFSTFMIMIRALADSPWGTFMVLKQVLSTTQLPLWRRGLLRTEDVALHHPAN
ncbi:hypothetical protein ACSFA8_13040 [Variovorax sp. RT4R15]|uniref:hypothetical protein n=1 Tax=Variovorax sp. RT4R15 TaxID=3443737 RepID=UPI003F46B876